MLDDVLRGRDQCKRKRRAVCLSVAFAGAGVPAADLGASAGRVARPGSAPVWCGQVQERCRRYCGARPGGAAGSRPDKKSSPARTRT